MDIVCPNCKGALEALFSISGTFRCSKENIVWKLSVRNDRRYLEKVYAPADYRGPRVVEMSGVVDK